MKRLTLLWALCAVAVPAQQIQIAGADAPDGSDAALSSEMGDSPVVTLPGMAPGPAVLPAPPASPSVAVPSAAASLVLPPLPIAPPATPAIPGRAAPEPAPRRTASFLLPAEFQRDSGFFCQKLIGAWTEPDAYNLLGTPVRRRPAYDADRSVNGQILAYHDPTGRYRLIELDFARDTGLLRTVFVYPWKMSWYECRRLWGAKVQSAEANKGRIFYSYVNRRLDVLVDAGGNVISLGLY